MFTEYFKVLKAHFVCIFDSVLSLHIANAFLLGILQNKGKAKIYPFIWTTFKPY